MQLVYSDELNVQYVLSLLKSHNIRKIVASPGTTNITLVASFQHDPWFEMFSSVDERSAAYIACGMAAESGEPVVLTCTGATASRNYFPGLTEAYYRKLPVLAITSTRDERLIGHLHDQQMDRSCQPKDLVVCSAHVPTITDERGKWDAMIKINKAILALSHHGGGPAHINLATTYSRNYNVKELPKVRKIQRFNCEGQLPQMTFSKIAVYVGTHAKWNVELTETVDLFCEKYNAVVFTEPCSGYKGKYGLSFSLVTNQPKHSDANSPELLIHIGEVSAFPDQFSGSGTVWRVSEDGELKDKLQKLSNVFEMSELYFFKHYARLKGEEGCNTSYYERCKAEYDEVYSKIPEMPLSNVWIASKIYDKLPTGSVLHLGILSTLRAWNFFQIPNTIDVNCNQGGFGIDGNLSSLVGASLVHPDKLCYGIVGDLSFFYDMNVVGNRHVGNNVRIMLINNGRGNEFRLYTNNGRLVGEETDLYISAAGHYGNQSPQLVKHYAEDLGYEYLCASSKSAFDTNVQRFLEPRITDKPMLFEVFTTTEDENTALYSINHIEKGLVRQVKDTIKHIIGKE